MECRFLFDLPPHISYNENDKDGKNASGIQTGSVPESDSRTVTFEIKLKIIGYNTEEFKCLVLSEQWKWKSRSFARK